MSQHRWLKHLEVCCAWTAPKQDNQQVDTPGHLNRVYT